MDGEDGAVEGAVYCGEAGWGGPGGEGGGGGPGGHGGCGLRRWRIVGDGRRLASTSMVLGIQIFVSMREKLLDSTGRGP